MAEPYVMGCVTPNAVEELGRVAKGAATFVDHTVAFHGGDSFVGEDFAVSGELVLDNLDELRSELRMHGARPMEVLCSLVRDRGVSEAALRLRGMFTLVVYHRREKQLWLVRDPAGARTLYWARRGDSVWFASRQSLLARSPVVSDALSVPALRNYLVFSYVPGTETLRRDVSEVPPGGSVRFPGGVVQTYWQAMERLDDASTDLDEQAGRLRALLEATIAEQIPGNEEVGVYLSGGLDSSLVAALAARSSTRPVHTYALHFGDDFPNELPFARAVAESVQTTHHEVHLTPKSIQKALFETVEALDDPIGDPLTVPNLLLGKRAASDVGVILNGEGGDPVFGGPKNQPMILHALYDPTGDHESAYLRSYQKCFDDLDELLAWGAQTALEDAPPPQELIRPYLSDCPMSSYLNRLMLINTRFKGADHILTKVNNLTRAAGVVGRSPLFDRRIIEYSFSIPPSMKLSGNIEKFVLKRAVADVLPRSIVERPKAGMRVPVQGWFRKTLKRYARGLLLSRKTRIREWIRQDRLKEWIDYRGDPGGRYGRKVWLMISLEAWLRVNEVG